MKLSLEAIQTGEGWEGYRLPAYDPVLIERNTDENPRWLHFGPGNIFRVFPALLCQRLIENGSMDTGIVCCEGYDEQVVTRCLRPRDNLTIAVTLDPDGTMEKEVVASVTESLTMAFDRERIGELMGRPSLQMVSFTITEKGYSLRDGSGSLLTDVAEDMAGWPEGCRSFWGRLTAMCLARKSVCGKPLALVSMDNCSHNGEKLRRAVLDIAQAWLNNGKITAADYAYLDEELSYPWSMIDKITPRPHPDVERRLLADGLEDVTPIVTDKKTYAAPFVNAERPQYLVIEDDFPNGRPPLERAGVIFTDRETVNKVEKMKVCTCLNPLHTALAVFGCLLGYTSIAEEMHDVDLARLVRRLGREEGMSFVVHPGVLDPEQFLEEVLTVRLPNPFLPDTPQRIVTDTSQKLAIRFGETIKACIASSAHKVGDLKMIPLVLAGWMRYLLGVDDVGRRFELSPDPRLAELQKKLAGITLDGEVREEQLRPILSDATLWGVDLNECGLAEEVLRCFRQLTQEPGAVRATLKRYVHGEGV